MAYLSKLQADEIAGYYAAIQHATALKSAAESLLPLAGTEDSQEHIKWIIANTDDAISSLRALLNDAQPVSYIDRERVVLTHRELF